jgi:phosphoglycerate kinase
MPMIKCVDQLPVAGRRVFVRVDFNVPHDGPVIKDDTRIQEALPTIQYLMDQKSKIILASHLGRPKGRDMAESLMPVAERLAELIGRPVILPEDCVGDAVKKLAHEIREGDVLLLENLRFHKEEEANDAVFAQSLAQLGEVYVSDAFGTMHRAHASTVGMAKHFKEKGIGLLVKKELEYLSPLLARPARPFIAVLGGAKVSDKIELIEHLVTKVDELLLGGGLAYTFLKAMGQPIGKSKCEDDKVYLAQKILQKAKENDVVVRVPVDHRVADKPSADAVATVSAKVPDEKMGLDIGPETARQYGEILRQAKTVFWNGPMGVFEYKQFAEGSLAVARAIASGDSVSIVGGGESLAAVKMSGVGDHITHLSTGGGAALEFLEGKGLPGLSVLES